MGDSNFLLALDVLRALALILVVSFICGRIAVLVRQAKVVGEMVAGILLGPTLFGALLPDLQATVFSADVKPVLYVLSTIGLTLYMFLVGAGQPEHPSSLRELGAPALLAGVGFLAPLVLGGTVAFLLTGMLSPGGSQVRFAVFVGGALSVTAFPMLARIVYERRIEHSRFGALAMLTASIDDAAAWCLLALITALAAGGGPWDAGRTIVLAGLFAVVVLLVVPRVLRRPAERAAAQGALSPELLAMVLLFMLMAGWFTDYIGIYSVFGGFIAGMAMPRVATFQRLLHERMMEFTTILLLPIFFTFSGLNTELGGVTSWSFIGPFLALLVVGFVGKYAFGFAVMRLLRHGRRESSAMASLMNARGLMILIFINIGLAQNMITNEVFSMLVLIAVVTTALAVPLYRLSFPASYEEQVRNGEPVDVPAPVPVGTRADPRQIALRRRHGRAGVWSWTADTDHRPATEATLDSEGIPVCVADVGGVTQRWSGADVVRAVQVCR